MEDAQRVFTKVPQHDVFGVPYLEDMPCMAMVRKLIKFWADV
jgi:hypothetical protein